MKLSNDDMLIASVAMLRGDSFSRGNATLFTLGCITNYCIIQTIGPADKCKRTETTSWPEALRVFVEYANDSNTD